MSILLFRNIAVSVLCVGTHDEILGVKSNSGGQNLLFLMYGVPVSRALCLKARA